MILLAIDDASLPLRRNLCYYLSRPAIRREAVLKPSENVNAPDNLAAHFYGTVIHDFGMYRMWYYPCHRGMNPDWPPEMARQLANYKVPIFQGPFCYAESKDGINWYKPALGQVLFKGSRDNNAFALPHQIIAGATVIRDDEDPDPKRRYKLVYEFFPSDGDPPVPAWGNVQTIATAVSSDGLHWTMLDIPYRNQFMEQASFYKHDGKYVVTYQACSHNSYFSEGGEACGRTGMARFSLDFNQWVDGEAESFALPEPADPKQRGVYARTDQVHLGVAAASFGNVCVGLYGLWRNAPEFEDISCDLGLVVSNDGLHFREPVKSHVFIGSQDSPVTPCPTRPYHTNLCQANGILNVGDETRIYHGRWRNTGAGHLDDYYGEVALATLPRDRWGALGLFPTAADGVAWTTDFLWPDDGVVSLNADDAPAVRVDVADEQFQPLPGFSGEHAGICVDSGLSSLVRWGNGVDRLRGRRVRLRLRLERLHDREPRLYAVNVGAARA